MTIRLDTLQALEFFHTHKISIGKRGLPVFRDHSAAAQHRAAELRSCPVVYMWLSPLASTTEFDVLYVGKAGYGISRRLRQHEGGFVNSRAGRDNRRLITELLAQGRTIEVHCRVSSVQQIFDRDVSLYSSEEQALCERYAPLWNRAQFPQVQPPEPMPQPDHVQPAPGGVSVDLLAAATAQSTTLVPEADFSQAIDGDEITAFVNSLPPEKRAQFFSLCAILQRRAPTAGQKLVRGYVNQPRGYNQKPVYVFGDIGRDGRARNRVGWISLTDSENSPLNIIFPAGALDSKTDRSLVIQEKKEGNWCPKNLQHFLDNFEQYLV